MSDITDLGGFLGGEQAEGYSTLYVITTAVEKTGEDGKKYMTFDFPEPPAGLHVPPEITPAAGDKVAVIVRVPVADKDKWTKYAKITNLGESKVAAEAVWPTAKAQVDYLPVAETANRTVWKKKTVEPVGEKL